MNKKLGDRKTLIKHELYGLSRSIAADILNRTTVIVVVLLVLAVATGSFKGFDERKREGFTIVANANGTELLEEPIELSYEPFDISIYRTYILDGARVCEMRIINTSSRPAKIDGLYGATFALEHSGLPDNEQPKYQVRTLRIDRADPPLSEIIGPPLVFSLNPKVPLDVAVVFEEYEGDLKNRSSLRPEQADLLTVWSYEWRPGRVNYDVAWWRGKQVAEIVLK